MNAAAIREVKAAVLEAVRRAAIAYANGFAGKPIVDQHFTPGNANRYGFAPLSKDYVKRKPNPGGPMLVNTGALRQSVNSKQHTVRMVGNNAVITFRNLMDYATYLHEGTPKMPPRSPVAPNALDKQQALIYARAWITKEMQRIRLKYAKPVSK